MNKLFTIRWLLSDDYVISVSNFWSEAAMNAKIAKNPEWNFTIAENNDCHMIVIARQGGDDMKVRFIDGFYCVFSGADVLAVFDTKAAARAYVKGV